MKNAPLNKTDAKESLETNVKLAQVAETLDRITTRLNACLNVLLDILLLDDRFEKPTPYTDKVAYLDSVGLEVDAISEIVGRPSNYVSSRLREAKLRESPRRKRGKKASAKRSQVTNPQEG